MTPTQHNALNKWLAEHLMGLPCAENGFNGVILSTDILWIIKDGKTVGVFAPSTDPIAAYQVREKMRANGWHYGLYTVGNQILCAFYRFFKDGRACEQAPNEHEASALAAARALGYKEEL